MNWEPMTEDAVFEEGEWILICKRVQYPFETANYYAKYDMFYFTHDEYAKRPDITHFARITNPNEVQP